MVLKLPDIANASPFPAPKFFYSSGRTNALLHPGAAVPDGGVHQFPAARDAWKEPSADHSGGRQIRVKDTGAQMGRHGRTLHMSFGTNLTGRT